MVERQKFLRMMSTCYWHSGMTLHLFIVALTEWRGSCCCGRLVFHPCVFLFYIFLGGNISCNCIPKLYYWVHSYRFLLYRIYVPPIICTCVCGLVSEICARDVCVWCSPIGKASPHHHQHHNLPPTGTMQSNVTTGTWYNDRCGVC